MLAARTTGLIAAEHRMCLGTVRLIETGAALEGVEQSCGDDVGCLARGFLRFETATRAVARLARAEVRVVAQRGLRGSCARAFVTGEIATALGTSAGALRDMRRAMLAGDVEGVERAGRRLDRVSDFESDAGKSAQRLRLCPRV
jgi:hypothetical protein